MALTGNPREAAVAGADAAGDEADSGGVAVPTLQPQALQNLALAGSASPHCTQFMDTLQTSALL